MRHFSGQKYEPGLWSSAAWVISLSPGDLALRNSGVDVWYLACLKKLSMLSFKKHACINIYYIYIYTLYIYKSLCVSYTYDQNIVCIYIYYYQIYYHISHIHTARASRILWCRMWIRWGPTAMEDIWLCLDIGHTPTLRLLYFLRNFDEKTSYRLWYNSYNN